MKIYPCILLQLLCTTIYASMPAPLEDFTPKLDPDALTHLIIDRDSSGIPIELWEEIILPYVGIEGGLQTLCQSPHIPFTELKGHTDSVNSAHFNHDGTQIVTASRDHTARTWDSATGTPLHTLTGHTGSVHSAQFDHDSTQIVTASFDCTTRTWNATTGTPLHILIVHTNYARSAQFNRDARQIVTASNDHTARTWNATTGTPLRTFTGHINLTTGTPLHTFTGHIDWINSAQFNHDSTQIVTASDDRTARSWHLPNTKLSLNQMILLWALEQHKQKNNTNQKLTLRTFAKQHKIPQATLLMILATFSRHDQKNIEKTFNVDVKKKRSCAIQ